MSQILLLMLRTSQSIPQKHPENGHFGTQALFFFLGGRLHDAAFASLIFFISNYFFCLYLDVFPPPHIFLHMLDGHILYMSNWIVLYVSCTKINVTHLSVSFVDTKTKNSAASSLDYKLPTRGKTHSNTHTQTVE